MTWIISRSKKRNFTTTSTSVGQRMQALQVKKIQGTNSFCVSLVSFSLASRLFTSLSLTSRSLAWRSCTSLSFAWRSCASLSFAWRSCASLSLAWRSCASRSLASRSRTSLSAVSFAALSSSKEVTKLSAFKCLGKLDDFSNLNFPRKNGNSFTKNHLFGVTKNHLCDGLVSLAFKEVDVYAPDKSTHPTNINLDLCHPLSSAEVCLVSPSSCGWIYSNWALSESCWCWNIHLNSWCHYADVIEN